ncbi:hypothetical protein [Streptomyces sp. NPDC003877]
MSTGHTPHCTVCKEPLRFGTDSEIETTPTYPTEYDARNAAVADKDWTDLGDGRLACRRSDPEHDDARDAAALSRSAAKPENAATRHVHITISHSDEYTANRAALSLADWITAEFPGHNVSTDAREWTDAARIGS